MMTNNSIVVSPSSMLQEMWSSLTEGISSAANPEQLGAVVSKVIAQVRTMFVEEVAQQHTHTSAARLREIKRLEEWLDELCVRRDSYQVLTRTRRRPAKRRQLEFLGNMITPYLATLAQEVRAEIREVLREHDPLVQERLEKLTQEVESARRRTRYLMGKVSRISDRHLPKPEKETAQPVEYPLAA